MKKSNVLLIGGAVVAGLLLIGYQKVQDFTAVFDRMNIYPSGLRNFKIKGLKEITFDLDITLKNNSGTAFSLNGIYLAKLKRVVITRNGEYIATANLNLETIEIPALSSIIIPNVPVVANTAGLVMNLFSSEQISIDQLGISAIVEVLGREYTIEN